MALHCPESRDRDRLPLRRSGLLQRGGIVWAVFRRTMRGMRVESVRRPICGFFIRSLRPATAAARISS